MALAAVAQALKTLVKVMPVRPTKRVTASGLDTSWLPPKPNWMSFHSTPASARANWIASAPICMAVLSNLPNGCRPTPMMATSLLISGSFSNRREGECDDLVAFLIRGQRHHGEFDLLTELKLGRVILRQSTLDSNHITELHQAYPEWHEILAGRPGI